MKSGLRYRPWAGLDLGSYSVKLLASSGGSSRFLVAEVPLPSDERETDPPKETVARAIADCFAQADLSPRGLRGLSVGVAGVDVVVKQISLPLLDEAEVGPALRFEARKHLPFDPQTMTIDFQVLGRYPSEKRLDVLLAAVSNDRLQRVLAPLETLGIEADVVDAAPLALTNAVAQQSQDRREPCMLLDIGHRSSHLTLYQRGEPYFSRRLDFGGRSITRAIARATQVPFEEAEEWKLAAGSDEPGIRVDWKSPEMQATVDCLRSELVDEVLRSFAFYRTLGPLPDPLRLAISGGTARLPGLAIRLADLLGHPVTLFDPLQNGDDHDSSYPRLHGPQFAQAFGLSLRVA